MTIDIVIAVAERGGVENVINDTALYLKEDGWIVRIVQLVWEGINWTREGILFFPLLYGRAGHNLMEFTEAYMNFLHEKGKPDIVLATAWPYMSYVAQKAVYGEKQYRLFHGYMHLLKDIRRQVMVDTKVYDGQMDILQSLITFIEK